jgi:hypothetical protein
MTTLLGMSLEAIQGQISMFHYLHRTCTSFQDIRALKEKTGFSKPHRCTNFKSALCPLFRNPSTSSKTHNPKPNTHIALVHINLHRSI